MKKKTFIPIPALIAALLLALVAVMTPFVAENNTVHAQQASTDAFLSNLTLSVGKLDQPLNLLGGSATYAYTVSVPSRTNSVRVTATANILGSQVSVYTDDATMNPGTDVEASSLERRWSDFIR